MKSYDKLLLENKAWAAEKVQNDPNYFKKLSGIQTPEFLWIGCSDVVFPPMKLPEPLPEKYSCIATLRTWWCIPM